MKIPLIAFISVCLAQFSFAEVVAEWTFSEGQGTTTYSKVGRYPLNLSAGPEGQPPKWEATGGFDGTMGITFRAEDKSFLRSGGVPPTLALNGECTIELLVKPESLEADGNQTLIRADGNGAAGWGVCYDVSFLMRQGKTVIAAAFTDTNSKSTRMKLPVQFETGKWTYIAVTRNASGQVSIYAGQRPGENDAASLTTVSNSLPQRKEFQQLSIFVGGKGDHGFNGQMGIVRLHNKALEQGEIESSYMNTPKLSK